MKQEDRGPDFGRDIRGPRPPPPTLSLPACACDKELFFFFVIFRDLSSSALFVFPGFLQKSKMFFHDFLLALVLSPLIMFSTEYGDGFAEFRITSFACFLASSKN